MTRWKTPSWTALRATLPVMALGVFVGTLWSCFAPMRADGRLATWRDASLTAISMVCGEEPGHTTFVRGFSVLGVLLAATFWLRDRQLAREPALAGHVAGRRATLGLGFAGIVALLVMAWIPGSESVHFGAALATFALLSGYAALQTGLSLAVRRAPSGPRQWPGPGLLGFMLACPVLSILGVVLWITEESALYLWAAVGALFGYFLALAPALARSSPRSSVPSGPVASSPFAPSAIAVLSALWLAMTVIPARLAERADGACDTPVTCLRQAGDFETCCRGAMNEGLVLTEATSYRFTYCPALPPVPPAFVARGVAFLRDLGAPLEWLLFTLALGLAAYERPSPAAEPQRPRPRHRFALAVIALATPPVAWWLLGERRVLPVAGWVPFVAALSCLALTWYRGDRLLKNLPARGFAGPLALAGVVLATGVALGLGQYWRDVDWLRTVWVTLELDLRRRVLAGISLRSLEPLRWATILAAPPTGVMAALSSLRDPPGELARWGSRGRRLAIGALALTAALHLSGHGARDPAAPARWLAVAPLAVLALAIARQRSPSPATRVLLVAALLVADLAHVLGCATAWLDVASGEWATAEVIRRQTSAVRLAGLRSVIDLGVVGGLLWLLARERVRPAPTDWYGFGTALFVLATATTGAAGLVVTLYLPSRTFDRALDAYRANVDTLPEVRLDRDALLGPTCFVAADGSVRFADPDAADSQLGPVATTPSSHPKEWLVAAARTLTLDALERSAQTHVGPLEAFSLLLRQPASERDVPMLPERGPFGLRPVEARPLRLASIRIVGHHLASLDALRSTGGCTFGLSGEGVPATLFALDAPERRLEVGPNTCTETIAHFVYESRRSQGSGRAPPSTLVVPVTARDTVEQLARRVARVDPGDYYDPDGCHADCGFGRVALTRDRALLEAALRRGR